MHALDWIAANPSRRSMPAQPPHLSVGKGQIKKANKVAFASLLAAAAAAAPAAGFHAQRFFYGRAGDR
jgi:hypothetical protein